MGSLITFPELLILIPFLAGIISFFTSKNTSRNIALFAAIATLVVSLFSLMYADNRAYNNVSYVWLKHLGTTYYVGLDGTGRILTFLTALIFPLILGSSFSNNYKNASSFYGLMMLAQAGLMGVFCAMDALVFYFYWELALIPVYFLSSMWGGEKRIQATFKFFVYTFAGSLLMLIGIIYVYLHTEGRSFEDGTQAAHSFALNAFQNANLKPSQENWLFWLFFIAFAIKMPVFPFHTWQPDTYDQAPTSVTAVLSGIMVKMGLLGVIRWLIPVFPEAAVKNTHIIMLLCVIGILYASIIALRQDNIKRMIAYSSIAHIGLMCAALFTMNKAGTQGALLQMFSHGVNIVGMWLVVDAIERKTGVKNISALSGVANKAPGLTYLLVIIALANIALPLTNAFIGEFLMFSGIWSYNSWMAVFALLSIILAAVYTLNFIRNVFYGNTNALTENIRDITIQEKTILLAVVVFIFIVGVYPQPLIEMTKTASAMLSSFRG